MAEHHVRGGGGAYSAALAGVAAIGGFLFGFDSGVINGILAALSNAFNAGDLGTGFAVASVLLGCAVGAFAAGNVADRFGRKPVMLATAVVFFASAIGSGIATGVNEFNLYRLLGGLAVGAASVLAPAYISEIAPADVRGRLGSLQQLAIAAAVQWLANFAVTLTFPMLLNGVGLAGAYGCYAAAALASLAFVARHVRETKGRSLEEMDVLQAAAVRPAIAA